MTRRSTNPDRSLAQLIKDADVLIVARRDIDPALTRMTITQARALRTAGVRHAVLAMPPSHLLDVSKSGRPLSGARSLEADAPIDPLLDGSSNLEIALSLQNAGMEVHAAHPDRTEERDALAKAGSKNERRRLHAHFAANNDVLLAAKVSELLQTKAKVVVFAETDSVVDEYRQTIGSLLEHTGWSSVSLVPDGGLFSDREAAPLPTDQPSPITIERLPNGGAQRRYRQTPTFRVEFPPLATISDTAIATVESGSRTYGGTSRLLMEQLGQESPLVHHLLGRYALRHGRVLGAARTHFELGVKMGDPAQLLDLAHVSALEFDFEGAAQYARKAKRANVPGAFALSRAYEAQLELDVKDRIPTITEAALPIMYWDTKAYNVRPATQTLI